MSASQSSRVIDQLRRTIYLGDGAGLSDGQLLSAFIDQRDEAAFAALVRRHGQLVLGVCRRLLPRLPDAEDAFQATFLVLVRKAASIKSRETVAGWLYGVAYNTALKARALNAKRGARERQVPEMPDPEAVQPEARWQELQPLLDRGLSGLPEKYRLPIVLCDLEGKPRKDAAQQLGVREGTLSSRLTRGRALLAGRLSRQGVVLSGVALAALVGNAASAAVSAALLLATVKSAVQLAAGRAAGGAISAQVTALTEGVLKAMLVSKLKLGTAVVLALGVVFACAATTAQALKAEPAAKQRAENLAALPSERTQQVLPDEPKDKPGGDQPPKEDKVKTLLNERLAISKSILEVTLHGHKAGNVSTEQVLQAQLRVFKAELDLCETDKQRIDLHEKIVAALKSIEEDVLKLNRVAAASEGAVLEARLNTLEAQIALERLRAKAATPPK
jgi:RNA polymerase sigma factor (sigma-70 family)